MSIFEARLGRSAVLKNEDKILIIALIFVILFDFLMFPLPILAKEMSLPELAKEIIGLTDDNYLPEYHLPESSNIVIKKRAYYVFTAYNSEVGQTDNSPCITANGFNLCENGVEDTVAANFLKFGTKIRIPELFEDRIFIVRDRMNPRHNNKIDIWMNGKTEAKKFGVKWAKAEVIEILE